MKDVTLLIAHPDDEALFLWPFLDRVKRIVCASNDRHNAERAFCRERGTCLSEVGVLLGCDIVQFSNPSEFYRSGARGGELKGIANLLAGHLRDAEIIATHNAWGEYGHLDHIVCHHIARTVQAQTGCELLVSDIATEINWLPIRAWHQGTELSLAPDGRSGSILFRKPLSDRPVVSYGIRSEIDRPLFDRIKAIYDARGCWTWAWEPTEKCRVYSL